jgi:hypothetical protein
VPIPDYLKKLFDIAQSLHRWAAAVAAIDAGKCEKVAAYAEKVADTLGRAADAMTRLELNPGDVPASRQALKELGRITGYIETMVGVLKHHLDGRKLAGVKRRLEQLGTHELNDQEALRKSGTTSGRLFAAEGYFRALADSLRA